MDAQGQGLGVKERERYIAGDGQEKEEENKSHLFEAEGDDQDEDSDFDFNDDDDMLKRRISYHPLYGNLVDIHLNCLKVGGFMDVETQHRTQRHQIANNPRRRMLRKSDLDRFMEAYCSVLTELREAMEEPQQETMAFINSMHSQLKEITTSHSSPHPHQPSTSSVSSVELSGTLDSPY